MTREYLLKVATMRSAIVWSDAKLIYGEIGPMPEIRLSARLKTTAGYAYWGAPVPQQRIELSLELLEQYPTEMQREIIPHEIAHIIAVRLFDHPGHGTEWKSVMRKLGVEPSRCHNLVNHKHEARKLK